MSNKNMKFVRLTEHAQHGCQVDLDTGWGITGKDVRQVPDNPTIQAYIRNGIARGVFEESSQAEWDEAHEGDIEDDDETPRIIMQADRGMAPNKIHHRLTQKLAAKAAANAAEDDENDVLNGLSDDEVKSELSNRGLATTGATRTLKSRLRKALEAEEGGDDGEGEAGDGS